MKIQIALFFILVLAGFSGAQNDQPVQPDNHFPVARVVSGPWLQSVGETEFTVMWTTNVESAVWVEIAPDDGTHFYQKERPRFYQSEFGRRVTGKLHQVRIPGLEKGKTYRYRLFQQAVLLNEGNKRVILGDAYGNDILKNKPYTVTTQDRDKQEIRFVMVNDIHGNDSVFRILMAGVREQKPDFVVFNGDMLSQIESENQITDGYLNSASDLFASQIPVFAIRGNHEFRGTNSYRFFDYFPNPGKNAYYSFRHGPAYFIFLDCGEDKPDNDIRYYGLSVTDQFRNEEADWLRREVETKEFRDADVKVVFIHMPPEEKGWHGTSEIHRLFVPILNNAGIDLMLSGHRHSHSFIPKGKEGNGFPILINDNLSRTEATINSSGFVVNMIDTSGTVRKTYNIRQ
jgi:Icc-related predicted phosphoesterase